MDILINDLQKIFGKTPINLNSRAISFVSKKTRTTLIVAGSLLLLGTVGYCFYKLGKKNSAEELERAKRKLKEQDSLKSTAINSSSKEPVTEFQDFRKNVAVSTNKKEQSAKKNEK